MAGNRLSALVKDRRIVSGYQYETLSVRNISKQNGPTQNICITFLIYDWSGAGGTYSIIPDLHIINYDNGNQLYKLNDLNWK